MYLNTESKTAKSTQRKLSRIVHTDFTVMAGRHLFSFWEEIAEAYLWRCYITILQISSLPGSQHHGVRDKPGSLLLPNICPSMEKLKQSSCQHSTSSKMGLKSQETKRRPGQVTSPLTQLGACFLACRKSFAMGGTMQDVCGEPGAAGGQTAESFFSNWLLFHLGKGRDILAPCQIKSGSIPLHVTSSQVTSEHSGPSTNWKHWGNHADLFLALPQVIQAGNHWSVSIF